MDGSKSCVKDSLPIRLSFWLSLAILIIALIAGIIAFFSAFNEAHELQDDVLRQVAMLFDRQHLPMTQGNSGRVMNSDAESHVYVQLLSANPPTSVRGVAKPPLVLPRGLPDGIQTVGIGDESYRVLIRAIGGGERLAVAQDTAVRDEVARDSALRTLLPFLILVPILMLVVAVLIHKIFKPVTDLSGEIDRRGELELHPIDPEPLPAEIRPFVGAINRLLGRVEQSMDAERRFVADAAHELRSPMTALSLQAERLADAEMSADARERLATLRHGIRRGITLLDQMLTLARAQRGALTPTAAVSAQQVYRRVLEDLLPLAEVKGIDIGIVSTSDAQVFANEVDLTTLVKNVVDNAIRYTPAGGRVDLSVSEAEGMTTLIVEDNGPGIPEAERERVFDPFYRVLGSGEIGSGLGLSIVRTLSARLGATVSLSFVTEQPKSGLRVKITFPWVKS